MSKWLILLAEAFTDSDCLKLIRNPSFLFCTRWKRIRIGLLTSTIHLDRIGSWSFCFAIKDQESGDSEIKTPHLWAAALSIGLCQLFYWIWGACSISHLRERKSWIVLDESTTYFNSVEGDNMLETVEVVAVILSFNNFGSFSTFELPLLEADLPDVKIVAAWRRKKVVI